MSSVNLPHVPTQLFCEFCTKHLTLTREKGVPLKTYPTAGIGLLYAFHTLPDKFGNFCKIFVTVPDTSVNSVRLSYRYPTLL